MLLILQKFFPALIQYIIKEIIRRMNYELLKNNIFSFEQHIFKFVQFDGRDTLCFISDIGKEQSVFF